MSTITYNGVSRERVCILGVDEGEHQGKIAISWGVRRVEMSNLTIQRAAPAGPVQPRSLQDGQSSIAPLPQWVVAQAKREALFVEVSEYVQETTEGRFSGTHPRIAEAMSRLFPEWFKHAPHSVHRRFVPIYPTQLRSVVLQEVLASGNSYHDPVREEDESSHTSIFDKVDYVVDWMEHRLEEYLRTISWETVWYAKVPGTSVPIRWYKDSKTEEIFVEISLGVFKQEADINWKRVIRVIGGQVYTFSRIAPRKTSVEETARLPSEIERVREMICQGVQRMDEIARSHISRVKRLRTCPYPKSGGLGHRFLMKGGGDTLGEWLWKLHVQNAFEGGRLSSGALRGMLLLHLQVLDTLRRLHALKWVHGNLHLDAVSLKGDRVRMTGFLFSHKSGEQSPFAGVPGYIPIERCMMLETQPASSASDMWSYGVMLYNSIYSVRAPFEEVEQLVLEKRNEHLNAIQLLHRQKQAALAGAEPAAHSKLLEQIHKEYSAQLLVQHNQHADAISPLMLSLGHTIEAIRGALPASDDPLAALLRDLLAPGLLQRPSAHVAFERVNAILAIV